MPTGRGSCACRSRSVPLRSWQRGTPPACDHQRPLLCLLSLPQSLPTRPARGWRRAATGSGRGVPGNPVFGHCVQSWAGTIRGCSCGATQTRRLRNQAPTCPAHSPACLLFPLGGKVGQFCSGLQWTFGTAEVRISTVPLTSPHQLFALAGSRRLAGARGGAAPVHGSRGSGCSAERLPGSKVPG